MPFDSDDPGFKLAQARLNEAVANGVFDNLPGAGKPQVLEEPPPFVSREDWLLMKVLFKDAGILPPEVELMNEVAALREQLKGELAPQESAAKLKKLRAKEVDLQLLLEERARRARP